MKKTGRPSSKPKRLKDGFYMSIVLANSTKSIRLMRETREEMEETFRFAKKVGSDMVQMAFHTPYPGSLSYEMVKDQVADLSELNHYETQHVNLSEVDSEVMEKLQRQFYLEYYFHPRQFLKYLRRRALYRLSDPTEWQLAAMSLRYLLGNRGRVGTSAAKPRPTQTKTQNKPNVPRRPAT